MGATGSGKTSFVNLASGSDFRVGGGLKSCTSVVQVSKPIELDDRRIVLVDTPGFDDTNRSDTEILRIISHYLAERCV
jgi:predicted GTPase